MKKLFSIAVFFLLLLAAEEIVAQYINNQAARMDVRATSRRTARRVDRRQDVIDAPGGVYGAPVAAAATTAAVLYTLPSECVMRAISGINYHYCNGIYYKPQYQGTQVVYVQVDVHD